ncbi:hypothetical protein MTO96_002412 [Rhipicephalus appendiculatus]
MTPHRPSVPLGKSGWKPREGDSSFMVVPRWCSDTREQPARHCSRHRPFTPSRLTGEEGPKVSCPGLSFTTLEPFLLLDAACWLR